MIAIAGNAVKRPVASTNEESKSFLRCMHHHFRCEGVVSRLSAGSGAPNYCGSFGLVRRLVFSRSGTRGAHEVCALVSENALLLSCAYAGCHHHLSRGHLLGSGDSARKTNGTGCCHYCEEIHFPCCVVGVHLPYFSLKASALNYFSFKHLLLRFSCLKSSLSSASLELLHESIRKGSSGCY